MCFEFIRGSDPHHKGGDGLLKGIYNRYYYRGGRGHRPLPLEELSADNLEGVHRNTNTPVVDSSSRSSLALAQNEGVITWTTVMADKGSLTLESLLAMSPIVNGVDLVSRACRQLFLSKVKSQTNVRDTFFPNHEPDRYEAGIDPQWFDFEEFANVFVCHSIYLNKDVYSIHKMINGEKVEEYLLDFYLSPDWKKVGTYL